MFRWVGHGSRLRGSHRGGSKRGSRSTRASPHGRLVRRFGCSRLPRLRAPLVPLLLPAASTTTHVKAGAARQPILLRRSRTAAVSAVGVIEAPLLGGVHVVLLLRLHVRLRAPQLLPLVCGGPR